MNLAMNNARLLYALLLSSVAACMLGCMLTQPHDLQVWSKDRSDRPRQPHHEFHIFWAQADVAQVRLEYRQTRLPDQVLETLQEPDHKSWIVFDIPQKVIQTHGNISAWRVTLLTSDGACVGERRSATWQ